ncbi:hypothetical protein [Micromonospora lupini]|uniref:hypothetical protein n=1 Tax=Micromonospora lupini TaxID=285679 RepID=UPI0031E042F8
MGVSAANAACATSRKDAAPAVRSVNEGGEATTNFGDVDGLPGEAGKEHVEGVADKHVVAGEIHDDCGDRMAGSCCEEGIGQHLLDESIKVTTIVEVTRFVFDDGGAGEESMMRRPPSRLREAVTGP